MATTYILFSENFNRYYTGSTRDMNERLKAHNAGKVISTKPFRPWETGSSEEFE